MGMMDWLALAAAGTSGYLGGKRQRSEDIRAEKERQDELALRQALLDLQRQQQTAEEAYQSRSLGLQETSEANALTRWTTSEANAQTRDTEERAFRARVEQNQQELRTLTEQRMADEAANSHEFRMAALKAQREGNEDDFYLRIFDTLMADEGRKQSLQALREGRVDDFVISLATMDRQRQYNLEDTRSSRDWLTGTYIPATTSATKDILAASRPPVGDPLDPLKMYYRATGPGGAMEAFSQPAKEAMGIGAMGSMYDIIGQGGKYTMDPTSLTTPTVPRMGTSGGMPPARPRTRFGVTGLGMPSYAATPSISPAVPLAPTPVLTQGFPSPAAMDLGYLQQYRTLFPSAPEQTDTFGAALANANRLIPGFSDAFNRRMQTRLGGQG